MSTEEETASAVEHTNTSDVNESESLSTVSQEKPSSSVEEEEKKDTSVDDVNPTDSTKEETLATEPSLISEEQTKMTFEKKQEELAAQAMTLDVAYQSLEMVRKVNLQVEFGKEIDETHCVTCLRAENSTSVVRSRLGKWMAKKAASPCLTCGMPVCKTHRSSDFGKQNIAVCSECARLFSSNYLVQHVMHEEDLAERKTKINHMLEVYDRAHLILTYSIQFIDEMVIALQGNTSRHNIVGLGSSATGVVSGGLGVAAACTILTPVGPPLLLASILFGGGATAATASSEAVNYRSEPNKMGDRILTLHSIISCIAHLPGMMDMDVAEQEALLNEVDNKGQARLHWTRTAMHGLKPLTAGALSAISIVTEAREIKSSVDKIRAGNPCEKAERLTQIKKEINELPSTDDLSTQLQLIANRKPAPKSAPSKPDDGLVAPTESSEP